MQGYDWSMFTTVNRKKNSFVTFPGNFVIKRQSHEVGKSENFAIRNYKKIESTRERLAEARIHLCCSLLGGQLFCTCLEAIPAALCIYFAYYFYVTNLFLMGIKGFFCIIKKLALDLHPACSRFLTRSSKALPYFLLWFTKGKSDLCGFLCGGNSELQASGFAVPT